MHFWIDKRSQTCAFSGRHRLSPALIHSSCRQQSRHRRRPARGKLMVTPVHRFQPVESTGLQTAAGHVSRRGHHYHHHQQQHQQQQPYAQQQQRQLHNYLPQTYATNLVHARTNGNRSAELDSSVFLDLPVNGNGEHVLATPASSHRDNEPDFVPAAVLRWGLWAFVLATIIIGGLKFYVLDRGTGLEALGFFALFILALVGMCTVSVRWPTYRNWSPAGVGGAAASAPPSQGPSGSSVGHDLVVVIDDPRSSSPAPAGPSHLPAPVTPVQPEPPPPPYHIAILLPHQKPLSADSDESPPPSYDKAVG